MGISEFLELWLNVVLVWAPGVFFVAVAIVCLSMVISDGADYILYSEVKSWKGCIQHIKLHFQMRSKAVIRLPERISANGYQKKSAFTKLPKVIKNKKAVSIMKIEKF